MRGVNVRLRNRGKQHRHDVHDDDRDAPAHPTTSEPADRRVQQDRRAATRGTNGPDSIPRHPQQQPMSDRGADEHGDTRRQPERVAGGAVGAASTNGGGGARRPTQAAGREAARSGSSIVRQTSRRVGLPDAPPSPASAGVSSSPAELAAVADAQRDVAAPGRRRSRTPGLPLGRGGAVRGRSRLASVRRSPSGWPRNAS
jgi:hypothetical protein